MCAPPRLKRRSLRLKSMIRERMNDQALKRHLVREGGHRAEASKFG
jgi:hypothetical protein